MINIRLAACVALLAARAALAGEAPAPEDVRQVHVGSKAAPATPAAAPPVTVVLGTGAGGTPGTAALLVDAAAATGAPAPNDVWSNARWERLTPALGRYFGAAAGVLVLEPPSGSTLGLEPGDVITALGGRPVGDPEDLLRRLRASAPGTRIVLAVLRDHARRELTGVAPAKAPLVAPAAPRAPGGPPAPRGG